MASRTRGKSRRPVIAVAQIRYFDTPAKHNVAKIKRFIARAAEAGADIVCFPETCVHKNDSLPLSHELIKEIRRSCRENGIWAIITDAFEVKKSLFKMAILIDRQGVIRGKYKKINLYDDSTKAGKKIFVYKTDFAKIGIAICWDLAFPELFRRLRRAGAEIVFCPSKWCYEHESHDQDHKARELKLLKSLILSRTFENLYFLAFANPVANRRDLISYSAIVGPHRILKDISDRQGLITQRVNLGEIKKFRRLHPKSK